MEDGELWKTIGSAVSSGQETQTIDLKCSFHDFSDETDKGEFIKDVCALANSLLDQGAEGYLVFGVHDSADCPDRTNPAEYITSVTVTSRDELERRANQILASYVDPPLTLECRLLNPALTGMGKDLAVFVIRAWTESHEFNPIPYVVKQQVGKLRPGVIMIRRGTMSVQASRDEIIHLVGRHLRLQHEALESELRRQLHELESELRRQLHEQSIVNEEKLQSLKMDFDKKAAELEESIDLLTKTLRFKEKDLIEAEADKRAWRYIAYLAIEELLPRIPEDIRERKIRRILAQGEKETKYEEAVGGRLK